MNVFTIFIREEITEWQLYPAVMIIGLLLTFGALICCDHFCFSEFESTLVGVVCILLTGLAITIAGTLFPYHTGEYQYKDITDIVEVVNLQNDYTVIGGNLTTIIVEEKEN